MDYVALGARIQRFRRLKRWTQEDMAEKLGLSISFVGHIERGTRKASMDTFANIANVLDVTADQLLADSITRIKTEKESISSQKRAVMREIFRELEDNLDPWSAQDDEASDR